MAEREESPTHGPSAAGNPRRRLLKSALRAEDSYILLFVLLILDLTAAAFVSTGAETLVLMVLVSATLLIALRTSRVGPKATRLALIAVGIGIASAIIAVVNASSFWAGIMFAMMVALLLVTPAVIGKRILSHPTVTIETLFGAVSIYVILGLLFAFTCFAIQLLTQRAYFVQGMTKDVTTFIYASYITLTTVGYGDFTPAADVGKMISVIEALIGQVFLVTAVARLVSLYAREESERPIRQQLEALRKQINPAEDASEADTPA